jgi:hypothetical protein
MVVCCLFGILTINFLQLEYSIEFRDFIFVVQVDLSNANNNYLCVLRECVSFLRTPTFIIFIK